jgi:type I restriction enzyme, S subunit
MNWKKVKLGDVLFFQEGPGVRNTQFRESGVKLLNVGNINQGRINLNATKIYISEEEANDKYKHFLIDEGDLVIASSGIVVDNFHNKIAFIEKEHLPLCMNTSTIRFKSLEVEENETRIDLKFFAFYLQTPDFKNQLRKLVTGSAQLNFGPSHLKQIVFNLPDLKTQQHIAQVLDKADALRQQNRQLLAHYDELLQSTFIELFGDPVKNPKSWEVKKLGDISENIQIGPFGSLLHQEDYISGGIPLINPTHISKMKITPNTELTISTEKYNTLKNYHLKQNDIIMGRRGEMARCALITSKENGWICGTGSLFVRPNEDINSLFLLYILSSEKVKTVLESEAQGITMANLNTKIIKNLKIPIPPLPLQEHFAKIVEQIEFQKAVVKQSLSESEALFEGLLAEYFG